MNPSESSTSTASQGRTSLTRHLTPSWAVIGIVTSLFVVVIDQAAKYVSEYVGPTSRTVPLRNSALSLGLVDASTWVETVAMAVGILLAAAVLLPRARSLGIAVATGLLLGGGTSNFLDRGLLGSVRDFWVLGPIVVNPADIAVLAGCALLAWALSSSPGR